MSETDLPASVLAEVSALRYALTTDSFPLEASLATGAPRIEGRLSHPQPSVYQLDYTVALLARANSNVPLDLIVFGRNSQYRVSNHSSIEQSHTSSPSAQYDKWDDNALVVITCTGNTSYKLTFKLSNVVGTIIH